MAELWPRLAADQAELRDEYDIVVVGSGYGGAITAARLGCASHRAAAGLRIAVLERGAEHPTGSGPETYRDLVGELRSPVNPMGFYEVLRFDTIDVIKGNALGGTSLNNFNAAVVPDREVFLESWPQAVRDEVERSRDGVGGLDEYFGRARRMLGANPWRDENALKKAAGFDTIAEQAGARPETVNVVVSTEDRVTRYGVRRARCTNCGDCAMICNVGAKNTLMTNYLPMAAHFGVALFTAIEVDHVVADGDGYRLVCRQRGGAGDRNLSDRVVRARRVVLAAGSLGSTGVLLRSQAEGLALSRRLGKNFSGNGDNFGVAYNTDRPFEAMGYGTDEGPRSAQTGGPSITSMMRFGQDQRDLRKRFTVQDISAPRALVDTFRLGLAGLAASRYRGGALAQVDRWRKDVRFNTDGALNNTTGFLIMAHDSSDGQIVLARDGSVRVDWPGATKERIYHEVDEVLASAVEAIGGTYLDNPRWSSRFLGNHLITAHPLGGCAAADSVDYGVVDHAGRVFDPDGGVRDGLYVIDGAVIPRAICVNPLLTISMFAERASEHLRAELGLPAYDAELEGDDRAD